MRLQSSDTEVETSLTVEDSLLGHRTEQLVTVDITTRSPLKLSFVMSLVSKLLFLEVHGKLRDYYCHPSVIRIPLSFSNQSGYIVKR
jgi:hypothetical protein